MNNHEIAPLMPLQPIEFVGEYDTTIVGAGLAGLAAAIRLKTENPDQRVAVVEKPAPQSNTQIAGQRYRFGIAGKREDSAGEINHLLASRNNGELTPQMERFTHLTVQEIEYWQSQPNFTETHDRTDWFGPQWGTPNRAGSGRGRSVLEWFRNQARDVGVSLVQADVQHIEMSDGHVEYLLGETSKGYAAFTSEQYVLAGGNACGRLFLSTNKDIVNSTQELAFASGISLVDSTLHMIHPFGNCDAEGKPRLGCFETDALVGAKVYLGGMAANTVLDQETTDLLATHQAHYHFPAIAQRFREHGSVVKLELPDGKTNYARVSHHYGHLGIETNDGISVADTDNLYAIGDASGIGYWTNHHERFPGFALVKCLADAALLTETVRDQDTPARRGDIPSVARLSPEVFISKEAALDVRRINSEYLDAWLAAETTSGRMLMGVEWLASLEQSPFGHTSVLRGLSTAIAYAHAQVGSGNVAEPLRINRATAEELLGRDLLTIDGKPCINRATSIRNTNHAA